MPIYEYHCPTCKNKFEKLQPMNSTGAECPVCEQPARKTISVFAAVVRGESGDSEPAPMPPLSGGGCCGGSCGCGF